MSKRTSVSWLAALTFSLLTTFVSAQTFTSTNFEIKEPVVNESAGFGESGSFRLWGTIPYIATTPGASTNFQMLPGSLSYAGVTMPTLSVIGGQNQVDLSWTAALNAPAVTYEPGISSTLGGPYTFSAPQAGLSAIITSLTDSTAYYLIVRVKEATGGALLGYSNEVLATTLAGSTPTPTPTSSGSSGGTIPPPDGWVYLNGQLVQATEPSVAKQQPTNGNQVSVFDEDSEVIVPPPGESITVRPPLVRQIGYVTGPLKGVHGPIVGATVLLERRDPETGRFELWPDKELATMKTDENGAFSYLVPQGEYRLRIEAQGFYDYEGVGGLVSKTGDLEGEIKLVPFVYTWFTGYRLLLLSGLILGAFLAYLFRPR